VRQLVNKKLCGYGFIQFVVLPGDGPVRPETCRSQWFLWYHCNCSTIMCVCMFKLQ